MTTDMTTEIDVSTLLAEVQSYLAAVDTFRAAGREPRWLAEPGPPWAGRSRHRDRRVKTGKGDIS